MIGPLELCVGGYPFAVDDSLSAVSTIGGYDTLSARLPERLVRFAGIDQGAPVQLFSSTGIKWEGEITLPPNPGDDATVSIEAHGPQRLLQDTIDRLFFQSRDPSIFQLGTTPPHSYAVNKDFEVDPRESALYYEIQKETYANGDVAWLVAWVEGAILSRFQAGIDKQRNQGAFDIRVGQAAGPSGAIANTTDYNLVLGGPGSIDKALALADLVAVGIRCNNGAATPPNNRNTILLINMILHGIADTDTFQVHQVLSTLCSWAGFDSRGINTSALALNAMPLDWTEAHAALADYVCLLKDAWWRLVDDRGSGPVMEADTWANAERWVMRQSDGAIPQLSQEPRYNRFRVNWDKVDGNQRSTKVDADPNPLPADAGVVEHPAFELEDVQADNTLALAVAQDGIKWAASKRYTGIISVTKAQSLLTGSTDIFAIQPGMLADMMDHDLGEAFAHRVTETTITAEGTSLGIEEFPSSAERILETSELEDARRRRKRRPKKSWGKAGGKRRGDGKRRGSRAGGGRSPKNRRGRRRR